eukprot:m51a1_g14528 hypothetical protein (134) ;mRNA; f:927142-927543
MAVLTLCRRHCNSSRLHLGGRVVIVFRIRSNEGLELAQARSEPVTLHSKTSYQPLPRTLKWSDSSLLSSVSTSPGAPVVSQQTVVRPEVQTRRQCGGVADADSVVLQMQVMLALLADELETIRLLRLALQGFP